MDNALITIQQNLESIKKISSDQAGTEFWSARDIMVVLGYSKWQKFTESINRAMEACKISGQDTSSHFLPAPVKSGC